MKALTCVNGIVIVIVAARLTAIAPQCAAQQPAPPVRRAEVIRGAVTTDSGKPMPNVTVIATMAPDIVSRQAVSDSAGRYEIRFAEGTGDYLVYAASVGYRAFRRRVAATTASATLTVDIRLTSEAALLEAVRVRAPRPRPIPDAGFGRDPTATDFNASAAAVTGALPPESMGDLTALLTTIPGMSVTPDGVPVAFGMAGQVSTTFNGMEFSGASIPRDARASIRVTTNAYDPSVGGFGGARVNVEMAQGGRIREQDIHASADAPALQYTDAASQRLGQKFNNYILSGLADGPIFNSSTDYTYNTGFQAQRRWSDPVALTNADPSSLALAGISADSLNRLRQIATGIGLPLSGGSIPGGRVDQNASFIGVFSHYADPMRTRQPWTNAFIVNTYASVNQSDRPGNGPSTAPSVGSRSSGGTAAVSGQWLHSTESYSTELTSSMNISRSSGDPYLLLPGARVLVGSQLDATEPPVFSTLSLGGSPASGSSRRNDSWETVGVAHFYIGSHHLIKLYGRSFYEQASTTAASDQFGTFAFNSLADLAQNQPASFTRTLTAPAASASQWIGAASVGDMWQVTPSLQIQPGLRFETNRFLTRPLENPQVLGTFGMSNSSVPDGLHLSPRVGFAWTYNTARSNFQVGNGSSGTIQLPPRGVLSGGIGEFRNELHAGSLLAPIAATGLPGGATQITCIGSATPTPDWRAYATDPSAAPSACAGGSTPILADAAPQIQLFDPSYTAPRSWRGNLLWASAFRALRYSVNTQYSYNIDQPGTVDLNFDGTPRLTLAGEANRPVFVSPASIVPGTGVISTTEARRSSADGRVVDLVSDLHSRARQVTITAIPDLGFGSTVLSVNYTLNQVTDLQRGFDGATFGSPISTSSARSRYDIRHQLILNLSHGIAPMTYATLFGTFSSGAPYSPMVATDINGDGLPNDLAFIADPFRTRDTALANGMRSLLAQAPSSARRCLERQLGQPAGRNSCEGPWTAMVNAAITTNYFHLPDGRTAKVLVQFINPLGGLDQALHGSDHLQGWGASAFPNSTLYTVRGFDPVANAFEYVVNPRFGSTRSSQTTLRAPFRVSLDVRIELGTPVSRKQFARFRDITPLGPGHGPAPLDTLAHRVSNFVSDYYQVLIFRRDSLLLTRTQVEALNAADSNYVAKAMVVWRDLAARLAVMGPDPNYRDVTKYKDEAIDRVWAMQRLEIPKMLAPLQPAQRELAELMLQPLVESAKHRPPTPAIF